MIKVCERCNKEFNTKSWNTKYCDECKHTCVVCGKRIDKLNSKNTKCCSKECSNKLKQINCVNKYGVKHTSQLDKSKEKVKQTKLKKYGSETYNNRKQASKTFKERYGVNSTFELEKTKQTILEKYGVDNVTKNNNILNKSMETNKSNHNGDYAWNTNKQKQTMINKYGVEKPLQLDRIKEKWKQTNLEKYGTEYVLSNEDIKEKSKQTCLEKYGVDVPTKSKEIQDKIKQTNLEKYGVEYTFQNENVKNKIKQTNLEKYGVEYTFQNENVKNKIKQTNLEKYGVPYYCMTEDYRISTNAISKINEEFSNLLNENNISHTLEFPIKNMSYDIHILNTNILIEINPTYTHNSTIAPYFENSEVKPVNYHLNKTKLAEENGYRCIHIFDWDDWNKIINIFKPKKKISAHKTELKEITKKEANIFLDKYHIQGKCKGNDINIGLFYKNELISLVTFGKSRYNKNYDYEFLRFVNHENYSIYGGVDKLFNYFIEKYKPISIISYSDRAKFEGKFFNNLGFNLLTTSNPAIHWYNLKTKQHFLDNSLRAIGADRLLNTNYGRPEICGLNNRDIMLKEGFVEVYDCGQSVYVWNKN